MPPSSSIHDQGARPADIAMTRWSLVLAAGNWQSSKTGQKAMNEIAQIYWYPLYSYARRRRVEKSAAQDMVQGFFLHLLETDAIAEADRDKGKFRAFLLKSFNNYMSNERDKLGSLKRGGGQPTISFDAIQAEKRYLSEPTDDMTAERFFDRQWTLALLTLVMTKLKDEYREKGKIKLYDTLEHTLTGTDKQDYSQCGVEMNMSPAAMKTAAHRLRRRYRELLRIEIAQTISDPNLVDEEARLLLASLG